MSNSVIDLSKLPPPEFVETLDYEAIVAAMLADFKTRYPDDTNVLESDPAYKILEVAAYRELLLRHRINEEGRALLVAFAKDADLDHIGITYYEGEERLVVTAADSTTRPPTEQVLEDDESYRRRLLLKDDSYSTAGASNAYKFHALSADGNIKDASITSPYPGTRLPFAQSAAPTGWTQVNDDATNNRMLRVVNGGGGGVGGAHNPVVNNVVPAHTHWFSTGNMSADHTHYVQDPGHAHGVYDPGHDHVNNAGDAGSGPYLGSGNANKYGPKTGGQRAATGIAIYGAGTGIWLSGASSNHTHSGSTDNGSSQTNWQPRYIDMIICVKN